MDFRHPPRRMFTILIPLRVKKRSLTLLALQVIKSRLQGAPEGTYKGFIDCAAKTVKADGVKALFKGFGPAMLRAFPANAATFVSFIIASGSLPRTVQLTHLHFANLQLGVELSMQAMNKLF